MDALQDRKIPVGSVIGHSINAFGAISDYKSARNDGKGKFASVASAASEFAFGEIMGGWYLPYQLAKAAPSMAISAAMGAGKMQRSMNKTSRQVPFQNAQFKDYGQAMTMRQAGMQMAQASRYNLQQSLMGNEAQYLR